MGRARTRLGGELEPERLARREAERLGVPATPSSSAWRYTYDVLGHVVSATPPVNTTGLGMTSSVYDTASGGGRLFRTCDSPVGTSCTSATRYTELVYDPLGRTTQATTAAGPPSGTEKLKSVSTYDAASELATTTYSENGIAVDALAFGYDALGRQATVSRSGSAITTAVYNPDGSLKSRIDAPVSATASQFGYDLQGRLTSVSSPTFTGSAGYSWRIDGLLAGRTWPSGTNAATVAYDGAKRPLSLAETSSGAAQATLSRTYDRDGRVKGETQALANVTGVAGAGTDTFGYDTLGRIRSATGLTPGVRAYTYDADSNRLTVTRDGTTTTATYDATDALTTQKVGSGAVVNATYDTYGNLKSAPDPSGTTSTAYAYNDADELTTITPSSGPVIGFTIDALGRHRTRTTGGTTSDTYTYAGSSGVVVSIAQAGQTINAAVDGAGSRIASAITVGATTTQTWTLPDLHGNVAGSLTAAGTAIADAYRYDPYGEQLGTTPGAASPWRYQGRLLEQGAGAPDLYDFGFRSYQPSLGAFTSIDDVAGSAQNPLSLNRFLYAAANPETLIDPDGHCFTFQDGICADHVSGGYSASQTASRRSHFRAQSGANAADSRAQARLRLRRGVRAEFHLSAPPRRRAAGAIVRHDRSPQLARPRRGGARRQFLRSSP